MNTKDEPRALTAKTLALIHDRLEALADVVHANRQAADLISEIVWLLSMSKNVQREVAIAAEVDAAAALAEAAREAAKPGQVLH